MAPRKTNKKKATKKKVARKVRCTGKTKEGKRCKRMTTPPSMKCHWHKRQK